MARPLLKKNEKGVLTRPPGIEAKIDSAPSQDWATLSRRARVTDSRSSDFLPSECLVHLSRAAIRRGDDRVARVLMQQLLNRAEVNLLRTVPDTRMRDAESVRQEILSSLMMLFTQDGSEGHEDDLDFYECKFLRALRLLRIDHVRKALASRRKLTDLPDASNISPSQEDRLYLPEVIKALDKLSPDQKRAVVLRRIIGHTEEQTAKICKVNKRTIRYRLAAADKQLRKLKEDL